MRLALACLKIVILETANSSASSFAVNARSTRSILSASDKGSVDLNVGLVPDVSGVRPQ
jgi:hypothetical protein